MRYEFECSVECRVEKDFAWGFWSDVANWSVVDPSVEAVTLDGDFAAGTKGLTKPRGAYAEGIKLLEKGIPEGMQSLAKGMSEAAGSGATDL